MGSVRRPVSGGVGVIICCAEQHRDTGPEVRPQFFVEAIPHAVVKRNQIVFASLETFNGIPEAGSAFGIVALIRGLLPNTAYPHFQSLQT